MLLREYIRILIESDSCPSPKVMFMAGAPGSGKSRVIRQLNLREVFKVINPDDYYEEMLRVEDIPLDINSILKNYSRIKKDYSEAVESNDLERIEMLTPEYNRLKNILSKNMKLFNRARSMAKQERESCFLNLENYLVDGTGGNYREISKQVEQAKEKGYDVGMIYVNVPLESSIERDVKRGELGGRSLGTSIVKRSWNAVAKNKESYQSMFGKSFFYLENSDDAGSISSQIRRFIES